MSSTELKKKYLSESNASYAEEFDIPEEYIKDMPEIIDMILSSKSIETKEDKQNWFNLLPKMNQQQISRLYEILDKERKKLQEIQQKYEKKKTEIKKKYLMKWQQMWYVKKVANIQEKEKQEKTQDDEEAEDLLSKI